MLYIAHSQVSKFPLLASKFYNILIYIYIVAYKYRGVKVTMVLSAIEQ